MNKVDFKNSHIAVIGLGHVGLPTALGLAELGWSVIGADDNLSKVNLIREGKVPFYETGAQELLAKHLATGKFRPVDDVQSAVRAASVVFICVGTPQKEDGRADLAEVEAVARLIAQNLNGYKLIVEKSTVPAITAQWLKKTISRYGHPRPTLQETLNEPFSPSSSSNRPGRNGNFDVASNPEFLREGKAIEDFFCPDRVVCGVESEIAREILEEIYRPLQCPLLMTDVSTAEVIKHTANAFLSTKISFINMVADLCEKIGADITAVARGIGMDSRIGPQFLEAGLGYGGYCFPKDLRAFIRLAKDNGVDFSLLEEVEHINQQRLDFFVNKVRDALWVLRGKRIGILGLAFKPGTDDIREAISLRIIQALLNEGSILQLYDPQAMPNTREVFPETPGCLTYCISGYEAARGAHALLAVTEWEEFNQLDLRRLRDLMEVPVIVDGRNMYDPGAARKAGLEYVSIGRNEAQEAASRSSAKTVAA